MAIVLVGCLAAGMILASDVFGSGAHIETLLFGSLLLIDGSDLALAAVAAGLTLVVSLLLGQRWLALGFDPAAAAPGAGGSARPGALRPDRAGDHRGALGRRRPLGDRALRRAGIDRAAFHRADAELAAGQRRPGRARGHGRPLALGQDGRAAGGDDRRRRRGRLRARRRRARVGPLSPSGARRHARCAGRGRCPTRRLRQLRPRR